jgi:transketolase
MMSVAAGYYLATGRTPIVTTYGVFTSMLATAQFRNNFAMQHLPVIVASSHVGCDTGPDGPTHQAIEDLGSFRNYPRVTVISPACPNQLEGLLEASLKIKSPVYMRTGRSQVPVIYNGSRGFSIGHDNVVREGNDITLFATGILVNEAVIAAHNLSKKGISAEVINIASINPLDKSTIIGSALKTGCALTIEDHYVNNGLGGAISQLLSKAAPTRMDYIALRRYSESGEPVDLRAKYGLNAEAIEKKAEGLVKKK